MASFFNLTLDTTAPAGLTLKLNNGAAYATSTAVTATIGLTDSVTTGYHIQENNRAISCKIVQVPLVAVFLSVAACGCASDIYSRRNTGFTSGNSVSSHILSTARMFRHSSLGLIRHIEILLRTVTFRRNIELRNKHHGKVIRT